MKMPKERPMRLLRRGAALAATLATVGVITQTADLTAARTALGSLVSSPAVVTALLEGALGKPEDPLEEAGLEGLLRLAVDATPALASGGEAVAALLEQTEAEGDEAEISSPPPEVETPAAVSSSAVTPEVTDQPEEPQQAEETSSASLPPEVETVEVDLSAIEAEEIQVDNHTTGKTVEVSKLLAATPALKVEDSGEPQILIMHTHTTEAYTMDGEDVYQESDNSRTTDPNFNMLRVGEEMKAVFEAHGFSVLHDTTKYDYPSYNGSYNRSLAGVQDLLEQYPTISVVLDVHRDALIGSDGTVYAKTTTIDGQQVAQVMLVVGTNDSGLNHPNWTDNMTLAVHLQAAMLSLDTTLPRSIDLRSQRFNQHLTAGSLLVEVGTSGNTLQEALAGARLFAEAASAVYAGQMVS
jgi:stage II sporulation protein P